MGNNPPVNGAISTHAVRNLICRRINDSDGCGREPIPELAAICRAKTSLRGIQTRIIEWPSQFAVVVDQEGPECRVVGLLTLHDILRAEMLLHENRRNYGVETKQIESVPDRLWG